MHYNVKAVLDTLLGKTWKKENEIKNRSLCFAAYEQFAWWIYQGLVKGNRRVLPSCVLWEIRHYPEANGQLCFIQ